MAADPVLVAKAAAWLRKALQDLGRVDRCLGDEPPDIEDALYHCQQSAEKALKTFLTWHDRPFRKTHDLSLLARQCVELDPTIQPYVDRLDDLTEYAWAFRHPDLFLTSNTVDCPRDQIYCREERLKRRRLA